MRAVSNHRPPADSCVPHLAASGWPAFRRAESPLEDASSRGRLSASCRYGGPVAAITEYDFDSLGWFRFERLCQTMLQATHGLGVECWGGRADGGRDAYCADFLGFPDKNKDSPGPFLFQVKFIENAVAQGATAASAALLGRIRAEAREIKRRKAAGTWPPRCYTVMSNAELSSSIRNAVRKTLRPVVGASTRIVTLGATELSSLLHQAPQLHSAYPEL